MSTSAMHKTKADRESYLHPAAGVSHKDANENVSACMTHQERPRTPEEIRKFRRSANLEPGKRFQHPSTKGDIETLRLEARTYGVTSKSSETTTHALLNQNIGVGTVGKLNFVKAEKIYHTTTREPLGKTYSRGNALPEKYEKGAPFGHAPGKVEHTAKQVIFPCITESTLASDEVYKKSHGTLGVAEQRSRGYTWEKHNINPATHVFGSKGQNIAFNGVSHSIADVLTTTEDDRGPVVVQRAVENYKDLGDVLGKTRSLGIGAENLPRDFVFGRPSVAASELDVWGAAETITGEYGVEKDDKARFNDLGCSITPGFRNITKETRAFGVPSVRTDLPLIPANKRSMADPMNYGDDVSARALISPEDFSNMSITPDDFNGVMAKDKVKTLFKKIGVSLEDDIFNFLYDIASEGQGGCSLHQFRVVMNDYLYADETGSGREWLQKNGFKSFRK